MDLLPARYLLEFLAADSRMNRIVSPTQKLSLNDALQRGNLAQKLRRDPNAIARPAGWRWSRVDHSGGGLPGRKMDGGAKAGR
jgi:hypothetical protein